MELGDFKRACALGADDAWVVAMLKKSILKLILALYEKHNDSANIIDVASKTPVSRIPMFH